MTTNQHNPDSAAKQPALKPAHYYAATRDWPNYFAAMAAAPARETLVRALDLFAGEGVPSADPAAAPLAIDLASGSGNDTLLMLARGWRVLATEAHDGAHDLLRSRVHPDAIPRLMTRHEPMEATAFPAAADGLRLINASFSLPFCSPERFDDLWLRIVETLPIGGRFSGQFFGDRDSWASLPDRSHQSREKVDAMLDRFDREHFVEELRDSTDRVHHPKFWHVFHVVARKAR